MSNRSMLGRTFGDNFEGAPSAETIVDQIYEELARHPDLDIEGIHVTHWDGEVTLRGIAQSEEAKRVAEAAAKRVEGVKTVRNEIRVKDGRVA